MGLQQTFIENLKFYRRQKKLSQKDLSIMLDKSFNYINSIEGGISFPPPAVIDQIAEFLQIDAGLLFQSSSCPENIKNSFLQKYKQSLAQELSERIVKEIEHVCREI